VLHAARQLPSWLIYDVGQIHVAISTASNTFGVVIELDHSPVASSPDILGGTLVFTGTRVPVQSLIDYLHDGFTLDQFLEFFPSVRRADAESFLTLLSSSKS
jgi:uncharacterized protein (DUF433 family)